MASKCFILTFERAKIRKNYTIEIESIIFLCKNSSISTFEIFLLYLLIFPSYTY